MVFTCFYPAKMTISSKQKWEWFILGFTGLQLDVRVDHERFASRSLLQPVPEMHIQVVPGGLMETIQWMEKRQDPSIPLNHQWNHQKNHEIPHEIPHFQDLSGMFTASVGWILTHRNLNIFFDQRTWRCSTRDWSLWILKRWRKHLHPLFRHNNCYSDLFWVMYTCIYNIYI